MDFFVKLLSILLLGASTLIDMPKLSLSTEQMSEIAKDGIVRNFADYAD